MNVSGSFTSNLQTILHTISIPSFQDTGSETLTKMETTNQKQIISKLQYTNYDNNAISPPLTSKTHTAVSGHRQKYSICSQWVSTLLPCHWHESVYFIVQWMTHSAQGMGRMDAHTPAGRVPVSLLEDSDCMAFCNVLSSTLHSGDTSYDSLYSKYGNVRSYFCRRFPRDCQWAADRLHPPSLDHLRCSTSWAWDSRSIAQNSRSYRDRMHSEGLDIRSCSCSSIAFQTLWSSQVIKAQEWTSWSMEKLKHLPKKVQAQNV